MKKVENSSLKSRVAASLAWKFLERGGVQLTQFVVSIVIARLLTPDAYGIVAILNVFIVLATVFVQPGLGSALIQKKDADSLDFSSVLYCNAGLAAMFYGILYLCAPFIAAFYRMPELTPTLRVMALTLFPGALNSLQNAVVAKRMQFRKQFVSSIIASVVSGAIGIWLAVRGNGAWALVYQQLTYQLGVCLVMWMTVQWRPTREFSFARTKKLLQYGIKLLGAKLIDTAYHNLESLIIGKKYSGTTLALYNKGKQFPLTLIDNIDGSLQSVMLPAFALKQDQVGVVKEMVRRTISVSTYISFPAMIGLAAMAQPLVLLVLGRQWMACVPFLQAYCLITMLFPLQTASMQAINALGRSDVYLALMTAKRIVGIVFLATAVLFFQSVYAIVAACLLIELIAIPMNALPNRKLLGYRLGEQVRDIVPNLLLSLVMGAAVYAIRNLALSPGWLLLVQVVVGVGLYVVLSLSTKNRSCRFLSESLAGKRRLSQYGGADQNAMGG